MNEQNINSAITVLLSLISQASKISSMIQAARAMGRDLNVQELASIRATDDTVRADLIAAIEAAKSPG